MGVCVAGDSRVGLRSTFLSVGYGDGVDSNGIDDSGSGLLVCVRGTGLV